VEAGLAAVFTGDVRAQPAVELITDACAKQHAAVEAALVEPLERCRRIHGDIVNVAHRLIGHANITAQIPTAHFNRHPHRRRRHHHGKIGGKHRGRQKSRRSGDEEGFYATHGFVLSSGEARRTGGSHLKPTDGRCQQKLKQHLTLLFNRDF
jgi:hypothetical protein